MVGTLKLVSYVIVLNLFLSFVFYPKLLSFQADSMAGKWVTNNKATASVYLIDEQSHVFNFYLNNFHQLDLDQLQKTQMRHYKMNSQM